jgi:hypothetical protein
MAMGYSRAKIREMRMHAPMRRAFFKPSRARARILEAQNGLLRLQDAGGGAFVAHKNIDPQGP